LYLPSGQVPMNEVQVLQIPHTRRDLRRHVDETVETETTTKRREFPATKLRCSHFANPPDHHRRRESKGFLRGAGRRENPRQPGLVRRSRLINASNSRRRNLLRANSSRRQFVGNETEPRLVGDDCDTSGTVISNILSPLITARRDTPAAAVSILPCLR